MTKASQSCTNSVQTRVAGPARASCQVRPQAPRPRHGGCCRDGRCQSRPQPPELYGGASQDVPARPAGSAPRPCLVLRRRPGSPGEGAPGALALLRRQSLRGHHPCAAWTQPESLCGGRPRPARLCARARQWREGAALVPPPAATEWPAWAPRAARRAPPASTHVECPRQGCPVWLEKQSSAHAPPSLP